MKMLSAIHFHRNLVLNHTDCILNIRVLSAVLICASKAVGCCCPTMWRHMTPLGANKKIKKKSCTCWRISKSSCFGMYTAQIVIEAFHTTSLSPLRFADTAFRAMTAGFRTLWALSFKLAELGFAALTLWTTYYLLRAAARELSET